MTKFRNNTTSKEERYVGQYQDIHTAQGSWYRPVDMILPGAREISVSPSVPLFLSEMMQSVKCCPRESIMSNITYNRAIRVIVKNAKVLHHTIQ